jgi:predicted dehydrogenase
VKAVSDVNISSAQRAGDELGVDYYEDYQSILKRDDIDVVSICTPSGLHEEIAVKAAESKKHVIMEKPVEVTLEKIDNIKSACRRNGVKLACIFNNRYRESNVFFARTTQNR